jgi:hypothetical protein
MVAFYHYYFKDVLIFLLKSAEKKKSVCVEEKGRKGSM